MNRAQFGPPDSEGFRTVSFHSAEGEILRVSLHSKRFREQITKTASDLDQYSRAEQDSLRTAAIIAAARDSSKIRDPNHALAVILDLVMPMCITEQTEKSFPELAEIALRVVSDACVKYAINGVVESNCAPRVYGEETANWIMSPLTEAVRKQFLRIKAGRPVEVRKHLEETRQGVARLVKNGRLHVGERPTQKEIAEEIGIDERALRDWPGTCQLTWDEWVRASEWETVEKAELPSEWLTAIRQSEVTEIFFE